MKYNSRWIGPLTLLAGLVMLSISLTRPAVAQQRTQHVGAWYPLDTTPVFPPGIPGKIQGISGTLNENGGADSAVYVPELHCLFAHYR